MKTELSDAKARALGQKKIKSRSRKRNLQEFKIADLKNLRDALVAMKFIFDH